MKSQGFEGNKTDLLEYLQIVWRRKWLVLCVAAGVFGITVWLTYKTPPLYQARVTIQLNISGGSTLDRLGGFTGEPKLIDSETEILRSRLIGEKTAVRLQRHYALNPLPPGVSLEISDVGVTETTLPGVYVVTFVGDAGQYQVKDPSGNVVGVGRSGKPFEAGGLSFTLSEVLARPGSSVEVRINSLADLGEGLRRMLNVVPVRGTNIIDISAKANEPQEAARTANAIAEAYVDLTREQNLQRVVSVRQFLEHQLASFREDLLKVGEEVGKASKEGQEMALTQLTMETVKSDLGRRLVDSEMRRIAMKFTHTPDHYAVIQLEQEIAAIRNRLTRQLQPRKQDLPILELLQGSQVKLAIYNYMLQKQQETRLAEASELGSARIIDRAIPPKGPVSPNVSRDIKVGGMLALSLAIGSALVLNCLDPSVRNVKDLEERVGLPVFGAIPEIDSEDRGNSLRLFGPTTELGNAERLFPGVDGERTQAVEAYRSLRTQIRTVVSRSSSRVFLFTSPGPGEGKSLTVANLAISMGQKGARVLVVDCDLRKPDQGKMFKLGEAPGISEVLTGKITWREATQPTRFENVDVLLCGAMHLDPAELLAGNAMKEFLEEAQKHYSLVLMDSPPIIPFTDASVLAPLVTGVLLVVRSRVTTTEAVARAQSLLGAVSARFVAVILNGVCRSDERRYYRYFRYFKDHRASRSSHPRGKEGIRQVAARWLFRHIRGA